MTLKIFDPRIDECHLLKQRVLIILVTIVCMILWFSGSQLGLILTPGEHLAVSETFLVVTMGMGEYFTDI